MLWRSVSIFNLTSVLFVLGIVVADALLLQYWPYFKRLLGGALGAEIGLLIFLHFLAGLFVIESFEYRLRGLWCFRWYFGLAVAKDSREALGGDGVFTTMSWLAQRIPTPLVRLGVFTGLFYSLETFLLPFLPAHLNIQAEILIIALILAWHTFPFRVEEGRQVDVSELELG
jgi:hypothetical protein